MSVCRSRHDEGNLYLKLKYVSVRNVQITKKSWKGQMCFHSMCVIMCVVPPTCWMLIINIMCVAALPALTPCCHGRWLCSDWLSSVTREEKKHNRSKYFHFTSATACNFKNPRRCLLRALRVRLDCTAIPFICTGLHSLHGFKKQNQDQVHRAPVNSGQNTESAANTEQERPVIDPHVHNTNNKVVKLYLQNINKSSKRHKVTDQ